MKNLTIRRKKWLRGGNGTLCNDVGAKCCLGFYATQCGIPRKELLDKGDPSELYHECSDKDNEYFDKLVDVENWGDEYVATNKYITDRLITANDQGGVPLKERERTIKNLFANIGVNVTFVD